MAVSGPYFECGVIPGRSLFGGNLLYPGSRGTLFYPFEKRIEGVTVTLGFGVNGGVFKNRVDSTSIVRQTDGRRGERIDRSRAMAGDGGMKARDSKCDGFRDLIEEFRDGYSVSYQPADARSSLASLSLYFMEVPRDRTVVAKAMEKELEEWLDRFPVPVKVTAYDIGKNLIRLSPVGSECHLTGYIRLVDDAIVRRWGIMEEREIPAETFTPEQLELAYAKIPFRLRDEVREIERLESRTRKKAVLITVGFLLGFPLSFQAILYWGYDLVVVLTAISFFVGLYKGAGVIGIRPPSRFERKKAERLGKREHYFFHCEQNPSRFAQLEEENFVNEVKRENERAKALLRMIPPEARKSRLNWVLLPRFFGVKPS